MSAALKKRFDCRRCDFRCPEYLGMREHLAQAHGIGGHDQDRAAVETTTFACSTYDGHNERTTLEWSLLGVPLVTAHAWEGEGAPP